MGNIYANAQACHGRGGDYWATSHLSKTSRTQVQARSPWSQACTSLPIPTRARLMASLLLVYTIFCLILAHSGDLWREAHKTHEG